MSLKNKVAIVTGASSGIGAAIAVKLSVRGRSSSGHRRKKRRTIKDTSEKCEISVSKPLIIVADVTKEIDTKKIKSETVNFFGKLDILVKNASIANYASVAEENAVEVYDKLMAVNLRAAVEMTNLAVEHLTLTKGNIVNISSFASQVVLARSCFAYCSSKAGLDHLTRCAALDLCFRELIRVNAIDCIYSYCLFSLVKTNIYENTRTDPELSADFYALMRNSIIFNRFGDAEEIGDLVVYIASDKGKSITVSTIFIDLI